MVPPVNQTVLQGNMNTAVFVCEYMSNEDDPWEIRDALGTVLSAVDGAGLTEAEQLERNITSLGPSQGDNTRTIRLKIVARHEYNNTEIRCVSDPGENTTSAFLILQDSK